MLAEGCETNTQAGVPAWKVDAFGASFKGTLKQSFELVFIESQKGLRLRGLHLRAGRC